MKKVLFFSVMLFILQACITDEVVTTTFHPDGSLTRVVEFRSSKKDFDPGDLCTPVDSTWQITVTRDSLQGDGEYPYRVRAERQYLTVDGLNEEYKNNSSVLSAVRREVSFEKKFMWFYTFYYYQETVYRVFPKKDLDKYLTDEDLLLLKGDPSFREKMAAMDSAAVDSLTELALGHLALWTGDRMFDLLYAGMQEVVSSHPAGDLTPARLLAAGDSLRILYRQAYTDIPAGDKRFRQYFQKKLGQDPDTLIARYPGTFKKYVNLTEDILSLVYFGSYRNRITLPGKLFDANGVVDKDGSVSWQVVPVVYLSQDQDMFAASRVSNLWAWLIAGVIILFAVVLWLPRKKY